MDKKRIFIIGNGYDLHCGLKSSFSDFFNWLFTDYYKSQNYNRSVYNLLHIDINQLDFFSLLFFCLFNDNYLDNSDLKDKFNIETNENFCWYDVETVIEKFITSSINGESNIKEFKDRYESYDEGIILDNKTKSIDVIKYYIDRVKPKYLYINNISFEEFLFKELTKFEKLLEQYLKKQIEENEFYKDKSKSFKKELGVTIDDKVINFNYTSIVTNPLVTRNNVEINVHGTLQNDDIIIGIDKTSLDDEDLVYLRFTKTFRKLDNNVDKENVTTLIPGIEEIIFYGHSLGSQDYSYFQSIFDFYNLYSSSIKLIFYYSDDYVSEEKDKADIKSNYVSAIFKMINKYGETFPNVGNGKNLLHKLILENRIAIKLIN